MTDKSSEWTPMAAAASDAWHAAIDEGKNWPEAWDASARVVMERCAALIEERARLADSRHNLAVAVVYRNAAALLREEPRDE